MPYLSAAITAMTFHVLHSSMFRTGVLPMRLTVAALGGYMFGGYGASKMNGPMLSRPLDRDIMLAFEERYMKHSLNVAGYNNNAISEGHNAEKNSFYKPY